MISAKRVLFLLAGSLVLVGAGCMSSNNTATPTGPDSAAVSGNPAPGAGTAPGAAPGAEPVSPPATGRTRSVTLISVGKSGESGTATLTDVGDNETKVSIRLNGAPKNVAQPAAIVLGDCASAAGDTKWELPLIIDGKADTTLGAKYDDVVTPGSINYSIRVRRDAIQTTGETNASCGDIK